MSEKKENSLSTNAGYIGAAIGMAFSNVLGMTLLIPIVLGLLSFFALRYVDKKLKAKNSAFGGLGTTYSENVPYKGLLALELGHVLWGALGISIYLSGALKAAEFEFDTSTFVEAGAFLALVIFFLLKPNWLSTLLLTAYHCAALFGINNSINNLSGFSKATREAFERGYITHGLFHGMALLGLLWFSYVILANGRTPSAWLKSLFSEQRTKSSSTNDPHERLAKLQSLRSSGLIGESDFEVKKSEILKGL